MRKLRIALKLTVPKKLASTSRTQQNIDALARRVPDLLVEEVPAGRISA
jgi:hypothetical protein